MMQQQQQQQQRGILVIIVLAATVLYHGVQALQSPILLVPTLVNPVVLSVITTTPTNPSHDRMMWMKPTTELHFLHSSSSGSVDVDDLSLSSLFPLSSSLVTQSCVAETTAAATAAASSPTSTLTTIWLSDNSAVMTLDPTAFFTNVLSGVLGTPLILAVPIVAALAIAGLMAALIISYANPEVDED